MYVAEERGSLYAPDYRVFFKDENGPLSPLHDIPLYVSDTGFGSQRLVNMVVEIPRWTNAKMEISLDEPLNPIKQDIKNGSLRFVANIFPHHGFPWNYGALPQTWENPHFVHPVTQTRGDNDPVDVIEIGSRVKQRGSVVPVKVLGTLALIDQGETDWKVIAVSASDPLAAKLNSLQDINEVCPGLLQATVDWFKTYKVPEDKPINQFAFDGEVKDAQYAHDVIEESHGFWRSLIMEQVSDVYTISKTNVSVSASKSRVERATAAGIMARAPPSSLPQPSPRAVETIFYVINSS